MSDLSSYQAMRNLALEPGYCLWLCNSRSKVKANRYYLFWLSQRFWTLFWNIFCEICRVKIIPFLPAAKKRSKTPSFNHRVIGIASSIPWKSTKIKAWDTKRKKSEASSFKQVSQRLLDNKVFQNSWKYFCDRNLNTFPLLFILIKWVSEILFKFCQ